MRERGVGACQSVRREEQEDEKRPALGWKNKEKVERKVTVGRIGLP